MTVSPGWYDDGVTPGVERWFDGRGWTETTRPTVPAPPVSRPAAAAAPAVAAAAAPAVAAAAVAAAPVGNVWLPQEAPVLAEPVPAAPGLPADPFAGGAHAAPVAHGFAIPTLEPDPEPAHASSAAAAGYPAFGTPYRRPEGGAASGAAPGAAAGAAPRAAAGAAPGAADPRAVPATAAAPLASPYTNAAATSPASPYTDAAAPSVGAPPPPPPPPVATPHASGPTGFPSAGQPSRFGSDVDFGGVGPLGRPYGAGAAGQPYGPGVGNPGVGMGPAFGGPSQDQLERAFRAAGQDQADSDRQTALIVGGIGVVLLVVAGGLLRATLSMGTGTVWTWGFLAGGALMVKAGIGYAKAVRRGARRLGPLGWTVSGGATLLALVMVVTSVQAAFSPMPVEVGSCFTDEGAEVQHVDCADPHDYTAVAVVDSLGECPASSDVFARLDGEVVCLVDAGLGFGD